MTLYAAKKNLLPNTKAWFHARDVLRTAAAKEAAKAAKPKGHHENIGWVHASTKEEKRGFCTVAAMAGVRRAMSTRATTTGVRRFGIQGIGALSLGSHTSIASRVSTPMAYRALSTESGLIFR